MFFHSIVCEKRFSYIFLVPLDKGFSSSFFLSFQAFIGNAHLTRNRCARSHLPSELLGKKSQHSLIFFFKKILSPSNNFPEHKSFSAPSYIVVLYCSQLIFLQSFLGDPSQPLQIAWQCTKRPKERETSCAAESLIGPRTQTTLFLFYCSRKHSNK